MEEEKESNKNESGISAWLTVEFNSIQRWDLLLTTDEKEPRVPKSRWSVLTLWPEGSGSQRKKRTPYLETVSRLCT